MSPRTCQACEKPATDFQCPLCQAEGQEAQGFFCSQECFAQNWLVHRNSLHKSGVVREKRKSAPSGAASPGSDEAKKSAKKTRAGKRTRVEAESEELSHDDDAGEAEEAGDSEEPPLMYLPWPPMPSPAALQAKASDPSGAGLTQPRLDHQSPRAVVGAAAGDSAWESFWPLVAAAAHCAAAAIAESDGAAAVLVVAGDVRSAHAFAWAARCAGLAGRLRMLVNATQTTEAMQTAAGAASTAAPRHLFSPQRPVLVTTNSVVRAVGGAEANGGDGAAALWLPEVPSSLLLTLPDVPDAGDLQGIRTRAIFFVARAAPKAATHAATPRKHKSQRGSRGEGGQEEDEEASLTGAAAAWAADERITHTAVSAAELAALLPSASAFPLFDLPLSWQPMPSLDNIVEEDSSEEEADEDDGDDRAGGRKEGKKLPEADAAAQGDVELFTVSRQQCISDKLDNDLATSLANGDAAGALQHLIRVYSADPGYFEEVLFNALCCDWGALGVAHAHHRLAHTTRRLVDASGRFAAKKCATLADAALRAATRLVRLLPPLAPTAEEASEKDSGVAQGPSDSEPRASKKKKSKSEKEVAGGRAVASSDAAQQLDGPSAKEKQDYANFFNAAVPNLALQATICHLFPIAPVATLDAFAAAWGLASYLEGPKALHAVNTARRTMVERLESRYAAKLDKAYAAYLVILAHLLYDAVAVYSLTTAEVDRRLLWSLTLAADVGPLPAFLDNCFLLQSEAANRNKESSQSGSSSSAKKKKTAVTSLSGRRTGAAVVSAKQSRLEAMRCHEVRAAAPTAFVRLPWKAFPLTGQRERAVARLQRAALEEILMAMPRVPRPMYIGDVGNLIGKWFPFNARYDGVLGISLSDFLSKHPEEFQLVGRLVTRRKAGKSEQVRVRFDQDTNHHLSDSDDEDGAARSRKTRDRELLTGKSKGSRKKAAEAREKDLPARARKKRAVKAFNKERFNRNYKQVDPSARVPGYVKHAPRRITGRGKKPNKRVVKRG